MLESRGRKALLANLALKGLKVKKATRENRVPLAQQARAAKKEILGFRAYRESKDK